MASKSSQWPKNGPNWTRRIPFIQIWFGPQKIAIRQIIWRNSRLWLYRQSNSTIPLFQKRLFTIFSWLWNKIQQKSIRRPLWRVRLSRRFWDLEKECEWEESKELCQISNGTLWLSDVPCACKAVVPSQCFLSGEVWHFHVPWHGSPARSCKVWCWLSKLLVAQQGRPEVHLVHGHGLCYFNLQNWSLRTSWIQKELQGRKFISKLCSKKSRS